MCGIDFSGVCHLTELTSAQLGFTKQLVFRLALPHISLFLAAVSYVILGGWALTTFNYVDEATATSAVGIGRLKHSLVHELTREKRNASLKDFESLLSTFTLAIHKIHEKHMHHSLTKGSKATILRENDDSSSRVMWNLFFSATTLTSIGYGNNAPDTFVARLFVIVYIFFGIPLFLITMADMAKFCSEIINRTYAEVLKYKFHTERKWSSWRTGQGWNSSDVQVDQVIIAGGQDEVAEFLWTHLESTRFVEVPFLLVYLLLISYVLAAGYIVSRIEDWSVHEGVYFVVMSVLTIGFGDFVPRNQSYILVMLFILLLGIVLATTCIDVVGAYYIDRLHFFGRNIETEDPVLWLKEVQQRRIDSMKREAMRRLFEMVAALHHMRLDSDEPDPPRDLIAYNSTADSVTLKWRPPLHVDEGKRFWYTISYRTRTPQERGDSLKVIDFVIAETYVVTGLKSFTLYTFSVVTTTRFGSSRPIKVQEYTEPCTVPQSLALIAVSSETATFAWKAPQKNNGIERYLIQFSQEPAPQFRFWQRYKCGAARCFTITDLMPSTRYIMCVTAEHNYGLAAMSKSIRFKTRQCWFDDGLRKQYNGASSSDHLEQPNILSNRDSAVAR